VKERGNIKARLHRRFFSLQLDAIFVAPKLHKDIGSTNRIKNRTWLSSVILNLQLERRKKLDRVAGTKVACVNGPLDREPCYFAGEQERGYIR